MAECKILKPFSYSQDGINAITATAGAIADIPDALVPGLEKEGYVTHSVAAKAIPAAAENKMLSGADENKEAPPSSPDYIVGSYEARDVGRGWYAICRYGVEVSGVKKIRKDDADAFNAMSADERAEYVAAELADA